jgi:DNA-binding transcriptional LysR family regulator
MRNSSRMGWSDVEYLLAVARAGSSLAAAKALRVSQSTVQRRLAELEKCLGCSLIERHPTGYRLTSHGKELLPFAESVEGAADALRRHAATFAGELRGTVRLTCSTAVAYRLTRSELLEDFQRRYPDISVELLMTERVLDLSKGEADVAIRSGIPRDTALVGKKIADVPWAIYASRPYAARHGVPKSFGDIGNHCIIEFIGEIAELKAARWLRSKAPQVRISGQASNVPSVLLAVRSSVGIAPLPVPLADCEQDLVRLLGPLPELDYPTYLLTHRDLRKIPRIAAFFDHCVGSLRPVLTGSGTHRNR